MSHDERSQRQQWRIFCAVELPEEVKAAVEEYTAGLRRLAPDSDARWERTEKLHLTMKFLGEIEIERVASVERACERAASEVPPFPLAVKGTGAFPPRGLARVLWLGIEDGGGHLPALQRQLEEACAREGFARETREFRPHLTIARLRTPARARSLADAHRQMDFNSPAFTVAELLVVRSELGRAGSRYTTLSRHPLGTEA